MGARSQLTEEEFVRLHEDGQLPLRRIAERIGVSVRTVSELSWEYGIDTQRIVDIDPEWLYREYVVGRRSINDIAKEVGVAWGGVWRQIRLQGIPSGQHSSRR